MPTPMDQVATAALMRGTHNSCVGRYKAYLCVTSDEEEDETAELLRELEKIKRERAEQKQKEVSAFPFGLFDPTVLKLCLGA